jgi:hypothetical protein
MDSIKDKLPLTYEELLKVYTYYGYQSYWQTGERKQLELAEEHH